VTTREVNFGDGFLTVEAGRDDDAGDRAALRDLYLEPGSSLLGGWREPGGPGDIHAAYELLRRELNGLTLLVDAALIGRHSSSYGGNLVVLNRTRSESVLGQQLVGLTDDGETPIPPALRLLQAVEAPNGSVDLNRPSFVIERDFVGAVTSDRPLVALRERLDDGARATGPWIADDRSETFAILRSGTFFTRGGLLAMGDDANVILRGGSAFVEYGGVFAALGPGTSSDSPSGTSIAIAAIGGNASIIGDIYGNNTALSLTGAASTFSSARLIVREMAAPASPASGFGTIYEKVDGLLYFKNDAGTEYDLTSGGAGGNEFADNLFRILGSGDATKKLAFEVDGITTATTRTVTVPDASGTLPLLGLAQTWTGNNDWAARHNVYKLNHTAGTRVNLRELYTNEPGNLGSAGLGIADQYRMASDAGSDRTCALIDVRWTSAVDLAESADWVLGLMDAGAPVAEKARITSKGAFILGEIATPPTPAAGRAAIYPKADGLWYGVDDAGLETKLSNVAGGAVPTGTLLHHVISVDTTIQAGHTAYVARYVSISAGITLTIGADADLEIG